ncbi:MAG: NUDIX domain-containing protein [Lentisphaeria bacterium]|nr:NUDIX domain-containing protein [Lentisphaeria bacterium]
MGEINMEKIHVCACVIRQGENILICGRRKGTALEGYFEFPGGKFEKGETLAEASKRELSEELGIKVFTLDEIGYAEVKSKGRLFILHFVRTIPLPGETEKLNSTGLEGQEIKWVKTDTILHQNLLPSDLAFARFLLSGIR